MTFRRRRPRPFAPFGEFEAELYDEIYAAKEYRREVEHVCELLDREAGTPLRSILELGCGTGGHTVPFCLKGIDVTGVDAGSALTAARPHLLPGGLLAFDYWDEAAVRRRPPERRARSGPTASRVSSGRIVGRTCVVDVELRRGSRLVRAVHDLRFFSRGELEACLRAAGFELRSIGDLPPHAEAAESWSRLALAVAR
jgi:hypothetical protein